MSQKTPRLPLLAAALVAAILIAYQCSPEKDTEQPPTATPTGTDLGGGGAAFAPPDKGVEAAAGGDTTGPAPTIDTDAQMRRVVGPELPDGREVDVTVRYEKGAQAQYEIRRTVVQRDRSSGAQIAKQELYGLTLRVVSGGGSGAARVRMTVDWMGLKAIHPNGIEYDFDTRRPDDRILAHPDTGFEVQPMIVIVGVPVEFTVDAEGRATEIDGADRWAERWAEVVERLKPGGSNDVLNPYADDLLLLQWSQRLFPPVGGGTMVSGEARTIELLDDWGNAHYATLTGPLHATHDDGDVFRVQLRASAGLRARLGDARTPGESAVVKVHVQGDADAVHAAWRFDRGAGLLQDAEIEARYQMWTSYRVGRDAVPGTAPELVDGRSTEFQPVFLDIVHHTQVERIADDE